MRKGEARLSTKHRQLDQGRPHQQDVFLVSCKLRRNTFLPGDQIEGTIKLAVSSKDHDEVDIEEVCPYS